MTVFNTKQTQKEITMSVEYTIITDVTNPLYGLTYEEVLEAVKRDGYALLYIKHKTPELCLAAVKQNDRVINYVDPQYLEYVKTELNI